MKRTITSLTDRRNRPSFIGRKLGRVARHTALAILLVLAAVGVRSAVQPEPAHPTHPNTPLVTVPGLCAMGAHFEFIGAGATVRVPSSHCASSAPAMRAV